MTNDKDVILSIKGISYDYDGVPLLQNINFSLKQGEILCLLGPSGSGKTTLLRLIAGLEEQWSGNIIFRGQNIKPIPPHKRQIGMMFQEYALFPHKNVWQNVAFGLEMQNFSVNDQNEKIEKVLELVGLEGFGKRTMNELSGGEKQRVALARSLAPEPKLLLLDEPLGSLDRTLRDRLTIEIRTILKSLGVTAIFVTHDQAEAFSVADKIAILHNGVLQQVDTPEQVYHAPANKNVAGFLGFKNLIEGEIQQNSVFHSPLGEIKLPESTTNSGPATLLIRPDAARIKSLSARSMQQIAFTGVVTRRVFQGSCYRLTVKVNSINLRFDLPLDPKPPPENHRIDFVMNPSALVIIKEV